MCSTKAGPRQLQAGKVAGGSFRVPGRQQGNKRHSYKPQLHHSYTSSPWQHQVPHNGGYQSIKRRTYKILVHATATRYSYTPQLHALTMAAPGSPQWPRSERQMSRRAREQQSSQRIRCTPPQDHHMEPAKAGSGVQGLQTRFLMQQATMQQSILGLRAQESIQGLRAQE